MKPTGPAITYAEPRRVDSPAACTFYHVMDLPQVGCVGGEWDLRGTIDAYLGDFDFKGKRALDVGSASGFLTFEMEKRGGVVSFDIGEDVHWNIAPFASAFNLADARRVKRESRERMVNGYWLAHRLLKSSARAHYGDIYALPEGLGSFVVVVMGSVLLHLRDPIQALCSASRLSRDAIVITDHYFESPRPVMEFLPDLTIHLVDTWWRISESCMSAMLQMVGFAPPTITRCDHLAMHGGEPVYHRFSTYVARRGT